MTFNVLELSTRRTVARTALQLRAEFDATGVLVFPGFYSDAELAVVRRELDAYFQPLAVAALEKARERVDLRKFACDVIAWNPVGKGNAAFIEFAAHARLHAATEAVIGPGYTVPGSLVMYSVGGGQGQAWHQDCLADDTTAFNLNRTKEKTLNAITITTSLAMLVTLGLALGAQAAESPKPDTRKATAAAGAADVSRSAPVEGEPVDVTRWAYIFRQGATDNPWETRWLDPTNTMLWGALWEEPLEVARVEIEFPAGIAVSADDLRVMVAGAAPRAAAFALRAA